MPALAFENASIATSWNAFWNVEPLPLMVAAPPPLGVAVVILGSPLVSPPGSFLEPQPARAHIATVNRAVLMHATYAMGVAATGRLCDGSVTSCGIVSLPGSA